jgi:PKD repeat protein
MKLFLSKLLFLLFIFFAFNQSIFSQNVFWFEDFDDGGGGRWTTENAPGSMTNPTPAGIVGLTYGVNAPIEHDYFVINDRNTPELSGNINTGITINAEGQFVRGRHYDCSAPNDLPNPFINNGIPGPNQSLHITAFPACATLLYGGTPGSDDWNCIAIDGNDFPLTQSEETAWLNNNINATGKCNLKLTADFFLGGDAQGVKDHPTILYSTDGGSSWKILADNLASCSFFFAGTCNAWFRMTFAFPADADNQNDLRIAFRWVEDGNLNNMTDDYALGASFNVDNIMITACDVPNFNFSADNLTPCKNQTVTFTSNVVSTSGLYINCFTTLTDNCAPTGFSWSITGPGIVTYVGATNANSPNPQVQFSTIGSYSAVLTVTNCAGNAVVSKPNYITVSACPPVANFTANQLIACVSPVAKVDTITFTDLSTSIPGPILTWTWSFLPATITYVGATNANSQNPKVVFNAAGTYQVTLTVTNIDGSDPEVKVAYITAITCDCGGAAAPSIFWTEDFGTACNSGYLASGTITPNGTYTMTNTGSNDAQANTWYISATENGNAVGACGTGCGTNQTLHVGNVLCGYGFIAPDGGASYYAGGIEPCATDRRAETPVINCTGRTGITLAFQYMENGEGASDDATLWYYNGAVWAQIANTPKTAFGACSPQGRWTAYSIALPATADNNANVKIGFRWVNNDNSAGTDPSFAVDHITLTGTGAAPVNTWVGNLSSNWATAGNWSTGLVPTAATDCQVPSSVCPTCFMPVIGAAANARNVCNYGTITLSGGFTLTIAVDLLNDGVITSNTMGNTADVIFATSPSKYKGSGTMYDVDVGVTSSNLTLETNMIARSLTISTPGTVDIGSNRLMLNKNLTKTAGTFTAVNGVIFFVDACGTCLDQTNTADVSINANQIFGNVFVNKTTGIKVSLMSAFNYTLNTPKTLTIQSGILDANARTLNGTGNLSMTGGELQLAKNAIALPELTGTYTLTAGKITLDGGNQIIKSRAAIGTNYYDLEFAGTGIKTFSGGNVHVGHQLFLSLPVGAGNYINAGTDTLKVINSAANAIVRTGGHVVGYLLRSILSGNAYNYYIGSTNADLETYYEPLILTPHNLNNVSSVTGKFFDTPPNPATVSVPFVNGLGNPDTISTLELEGYWQLRPDKTPSGGNYDVSVAPDRRFWTFGATLGGGRYALLKQSSTGIPWDFIIGGIRVNDSTTINLLNFSNFALGYADGIIPPPLPIELLNFSGYCNNGEVELLWISASETNSENYIIEKSVNGIDFSVVEEVPSHGNSAEILKYEYYDKIDNSNAGEYYRLSERDFDGVIKILNTIYISCENSGSEFKIGIYPNPAGNIIYMNIYSDMSGLASMNVYDMYGKMVYSNENISIRQGINFNEYNFPSGLVSGIYFMVTTFENKANNFKLIILR